MNLAGHPTFADEVRFIEGREDLVETHYALCEWGQWSRSGESSRDGGCVSPGVNGMVGDPDPDRDPEAAPSFIRPAFNERRMAEIDTKIHSFEFPVIWRKVLKANYVPMRLLGFVLPENQRPQEAAGKGKIPMSQQVYLSSLEGALERLGD